MTWSSALLDDLRALAERSGTLASFEAQLRALQARHATKQAFLRQLREKMPPGKR